jgi:NTP pyrophosphatase (non-canonical NTP hydrolase)
VKRKYLNELRDEAFSYAEKQGFHKEPINFGEKLMLVVSELSEALEADREEKWCKAYLADNFYRDNPIVYENIVRGTVEEEIADSVIRLCDLAGIYGIDLEWHIAAKMAYNKTRPYLHGKKYG